MFPKLYNANETNFIHNGLGLLTGTISAIATEELNGMFELNMEYDSEGFLADVIQEEMIIKAKANDKQDEQLFRIYSITKNHENDNLIIAGQHITYDLGNNFVEKLEARNLTKRQVMQLIGSSTSYEHPFNVTSTNTTTQSSTNLYRTNPLQMIGGMDGSVLQIWGGQIERDNFHLIMHDRRGSDDGVLVIYKKNLTGPNAKFDISSLKTRIFPFVFKEATDDEPEQLITVPGKYIDSPHINDYEMPYIFPVDFSSEEGIETSQDLLKVASSWFEETGRDKPKVEMEVQFEHLWETEEYKDVAVLELVGMGDTITVRHGKLNVEGTAIVNRIEYDVLAEKNIAVDVGNVKASFTDKVNDVGKIIDRVDEIDKNANQAIRSANGKNTIYYGPDEPTGNINVDDLWFRVVDGEYSRTYRFDGIQWQLIMSKDVKDIEETANSARNRAEESVEKAELATSNANEAIAEAQTAFDKAQESLTTAEGLTSRMQSVEGNITTINQTTESYGRRIENAEGDISTLSNTAKGLQTRVSDAEGNISSVTQLANALQSDLRNAKGDINTLTETASSMQRTITSVRDDLDGLEIGGTNLFLNSENKRISPYRDPAITHEDDVTVEEWGTSTAKRAYGTAGSNSIFATYPSGRPGNDNKVREGQDYIHSIYVKNNHESNNLIVSNNNGRSKAVAPGEITRVVLQAKGNGTSNLQFNFGTGSAGSPFDFMYWHPQIEKGNKATPWSPAPEDLATQSQITQLADDINLRVVKGETITQINIDGRDSSVLIEGRNLILDGDTTVTGTFRVKDANITSVDAGKITVGELVGHSLVGGSVIGGYIEQQSGSRRLEMYEGKLDSFYNNKRTMTFGQYSLDFYNRNQNLLGQIVPLINENNSTYEGLGLIVENDFFTVGMRQGGYIRPVLRSSFYDNVTTLSGPYRNANAGASLRLFGNRRLVSEDRFSAFDQPAIILDQSDTTNDVDIYFGGFGRRTDASTYFRHRSSASTSSLKMRVAPSYVRIYDQLRVGGTNNPSGIYPYANSIQWRYDVNNYIRQQDNGRVEFYSANNMRHSFDSSGNAEHKGALDLGGALRVPSAYSNTTSNSANLHIFSGTGRLARSTSARKYKEHIQLASDVDYQKILELDVKSWYDKGELERNNGSTLGLNRYYGLIANEFEEVGLSQMAVYDNGEIENYSDRAWTLLIPNIRDLKKEIESLSLQHEHIIVPSIKALDTKLGSELSILRKQNEELILKVAQLESRINKLEAA